MGERDRSSLAGHARQGAGCHDRRSLDLLQPDRAENLRLARGRGDVLALFPELDQLLDRPAALLSGGEQQMLGLAAVLSRQPKLLLIDELSFGLAPRVVQRLMKAVRERGRLGHGRRDRRAVARLALDVADRAYVLVNGRVETEGSTDELRANVGEIESKYLGVH